MSNFANTCLGSYCGYVLSAIYFLLIALLAISGMGTSEILSSIFEKFCSIVCSIDGNGIITLIGIIVATIFVNKQVYQANIQLHNENKQLLQENRQSRQNKLKNHAVAAAKNICFHDIREGCFFEDDADSVRYISAWRVDKRINNDNNKISYHFNFLFRILREGEEFNHAFQDLCNIWNEGRWDYQILIPKIGKSFGSMSGMAKAGGIEKIDYNWYQLILRAMKNIQLYDYESMSKCQRDLIHSDMKFANDKLLDEGIFEGRGSRP